VRREDLKRSFDRIEPDKTAQKRMLNNILSHSGKEKKMAFNIRKAVPALGLAVVIAGSLLAYDMMAGKNEIPVPNYGIDNIADGREDMVAPLLNQFQMGNRHYIFLSDDLRAEYGFPQQINENDTGDKLTTITTSVDPSLVGSEVYSYKPAGGEAIVAVKNDNEFRLFKFFTFESYNNNQDEDAVEYLKLYGINQAEDIAKVQFIVHTEQSKIEGKLGIRGELTEREGIAQFYKYFSVLKNSSDKYFDRLFNFKPGGDTGIDVEVDVPNPGLVPPDAAGQNVVDPVGPDSPVQAPDTVGYAEDMPAVRDDNGEAGVVNGRMPVIKDYSKGMMEMGNGSSTVGGTAPSQGTADNALANPVTIRIYNHSGVYHETVYYSNIGFISRYEVNEEFADFIENCIK
jgi:hypothetical protein